MGFLDEILPSVRESVDASAYLAGLPEAPSTRPPSFRSAITDRASQLGCVVEFKRASPGYADSRLPSVPVDHFVRTVERSGAVAISCLACAPRFGGSPADVAALTRKTSLPVLFKDFILGPRQLEAAQRTGAAAVLLIARLEVERRLPFSLAEFNDEAHRRGLETLLELHHPEDLEVARKVSADVYGVNVRDLDTLRLERGRAAEVLRGARSFRPLLGLSGVEGTAEVEWFRSLGVDGFLVGTSVARARDPEAFITALVNAGKVESR
jgi:indole-3-glycerol phosphate synthase